MNLSLRQALKYTTDTVRTLLAELQKPEHKGHRQGGERFKLLRGFLADALRDAAGGHTDRAVQEDLHRQADLLQDPQQHIVIRDGKVRAGRFGVGAVLPLLNQFNQQVAQGEGFGPVVVRQHEKGRVSIAPNPEADPEIGTGVKVLPKSLSRYLHSLLTGEILTHSDPLPATHPLIEAIGRTEPEEVDTDHPSEQVK